jgi:hypothetical protein
VAPCTAYSQADWAPRGDSKTSKGVVFKKVLKGTRITHEIYRYDVAPAFVNECSAADDVACANQVWERMMAFLKAQIA